MRIDQPAPAAQPSPARPATGGAPGFAQLMNRQPEPEPAREVAGVSTRSAPALPSERRAGDREARRHGRAMLQALAALQLAVLGGGGGNSEPTPLQRLANLAGSLPEAEDPALQGALADIALRAAVELARRGTGAAEAKPWG